MKKFINSLLLFIITVLLCACGATETQIQEVSNALTDAEMERVQAIFAEYVGSELEYTPVYCGEWREGKQYKTENYAYGQYLIDMDADGYVHMVVWVQDKNGEETREVMYNRLEYETSVPVAVTATDNAVILLIDGKLGDYGQEVTIPSETFGEYTYIWYKVPAGDYTVTCEKDGYFTIFVVGDDSSEDVRSSTALTKSGESHDITVSEESHIELTVGAIISLSPKA